MVSLRQGQGQGRGDQREDQGTSGAGNHLCLDLGAVLVGMLSYKSNRPSRFFSSLIYLIHRREKNTTRTCLSS